VVEGKDRTLLSAIDEAYGKSARAVKDYLEKIKETRKA
jgi:hypothetical protein